MVDVLCVETCMHRCVSEQYLCVQLDLPALVSPAGPLLRTLVQKGQELVEAFRKLQVDRNEVVCFKFLILFSTGRCCLYFFVEVVNCHQVYCSI